MEPTDYYPVPHAVAKHANLDANDYQQLYQYSITHPEQFWEEQAKARLSFSKSWDTVHNSDLSQGKIRWFEGAQLNIAYNCIDRHLKKHADKVAFIFEHNDPTQSYSLTYQQLHEQVCKLANVLKAYGIEKGDRVCIYLPMIAEAAIAMLACARIGAIHSVVFGGFSADALANRINDCQAKVMITSDGGYRGNKITPVKANVDKALQHTSYIKHVIVIEVTKTPIDWNSERDIWYHHVMEKANNDCPCEPMQAEDPLFILYTSGSTGKPKGVLHTSAGYLLYAATTFDYTFDYHEGDIFWCTADIGWITGHSYCVYGSLANGATSVLFGGTPDYPDYSRFWQVIDKHQVNLFYTAPTAIRSLMRQGNAPLQTTSRQSLRILGSVGEPINPEAWHWYYHRVGQERCRIVDTWWQTETGGHLLTPLPGATPLKPGCAAQPFLGIQPAILDTDGNECQGACEGILVIKQDWPGMLRSIWQNHQRFIDTYLAPYKGYYFTGDGAKRDQDGDYWITGRMDDILNVSGHRFSTAEIESTLVKHPAVAEAAIVGYPHDTKGQGIYAYITLMNDAQPSDDLKKQLISYVRQKMGPIYGIDLIQWAPNLPKTRSGKIMRRLLRKIAANELDSLGDISTLADSDALNNLIEDRQNIETP